MGHCSLNAQSEFKDMILVFQEYALYQALYSHLINLLFSKFLESLSEYRYLFNLFFNIKLKLLSIYSLYYMQTILVMMFSIENLNEGFTVFAYALQWTKFDLSFMLYNIQKLFGCEQPSNKMMRLGFNCQSTVHNYMLLIILSVAIIVLIVGIKEIEINIKMNNSVERCKKRT